MIERALAPKPRIEPVPPNGGDADTQALLKPLGGVAGSNFVRTLVRNPRIFKRWFPYSDVLLHGSLPDRDRALLVLRATYRSESAYAWKEHLSMARRCSLTEGEIGRIREGDITDWPRFEAELLRAVDQLIEEHALSDRTWATLAERYDERQMIEVPMVVGVFYALGCTLNSLGVQLDSGGR